MNIDKRIVMHNFNRHASEYDRCAGPQREMADRLLRMAREACGSLPVRRALEIGCGTGYLTERLASGWPAAEWGARVVAVDFADNMLTEAKRRLARTCPAGRVEWRLGDAERPGEVLEPEERFDLIVANAVFQWFGDPEGMLQACLRRLAPGGVLALSTFGPDTFRKLHESFRLAETELGLEPRPHGLTYPDRGRWRRFAGPFASGMTLEEERRTLLCASVLDFLAAVKRMGASYSPARETAGGAHRALFRAMERHYQERFGVREEASPGRTDIPATYHVYYVLFRDVGTEAAGENRE